MICRITSVSYSGPLDVELRSWAVAGLEKPSVARLNRVVTAEKSLLTKYLGKLAESDAATVRAAWNLHMTL
jgi:mRNA interferase MazF